MTSISPVAGPCWCGWVAFTTVGFRRRRGGAGHGMLRASGPAPSGSVGIVVLLASDVLGVGVQLTGQVP